MSNTILRVLHIVGLTLFLGSIWVYIAMGTPMTGAAVTSYARTTVEELVAELTLPGLVLTIATGMIMAAGRRRPLADRFVRIKALGGVTALAVGLTINYFVRESARLAAPIGVSDPAAFKTALTAEAALGAFNVLLTLALITFSLRALRGRRFRAA